MNSVHHLAAHWIDEDAGITGVHHHLTEVWVDEAQDEGTVSPPEIPDVAKMPA